MHQYVQHEWSPALWALILAILAVLVVVGMSLFLLGAARPKRYHFSGDGGSEPRTSRAR